MARHAAARPWRILLAEDEYFLAQELARDLTSRGAEIAGFAPTLEKVMQLAEGGADFDAAILDINLRDEVVFPAVPMLRERKVSLVFVTGYDDAVVPEEFCDIPRLIKPADCNEIMTALGRGVHGASKTGKH
jgi:ActR/RegA family two-component response regulator